MSAGAQTLRVASRFERSSPAAASDQTGESRQWIRLAAFAALALYAVVRWGTLLHPAPTARLIGLFGLAVVMAGGVPWLARFDPVAPIALAIAVVLIAFPVAGLPWQWFVHERIADSVNLIGNGLSALPNVVVPYSGAGHAVRLVMTLGAAVLLIDAAAVMAFAPAGFGDLRRASTALPLVALAVVPSTLVRPQLPYVQGLILFGLLAAFQWGDRIRRNAAGTAVVLAAAIGIGAAIAAPQLDQHKPWLNYRAWAGTLGVVHLDSFNWNQTYGPLHWPRSGHVVLTVRAQQADYWKAQDLDLFNGYAWVRGGQSGQLPAADPSRAELARWTQRISVTVQGMRTSDVIAAGVAGQPAIAGGAAEGPDPGAWVAADELRPGTTYSVPTYSPHPSPAELTADTSGYPVAALSSYLTLSLPPARGNPLTLPAITFPAFHSRQGPSVASGSLVSNTARLVQASPYGRAYALARQLAARARTPYAFVTSVERYLSRGYRYDEKPPARTYSLESFLFTDKLGYCQQFSGAMALLLRMGGVPVRVAAGFTSGSFDTVSHEWTVSDIDAHAWDEVWFPRYGWVRFDPTPATAPARSGATGIEPIEKKLPGSLGTAAHAPRRDPGATTNAFAAKRHAGHGTSSPLLPIAAALLAVLLVLGLGRMLVARPLADEQLLTELERALTRSGRPLSGGVTLAALERRFHDSPGAVEYVRSLRLARYGGVNIRPTPSQRRALREQLRHGLGKRGRLRALWALPPRPGMSSRRRRGSLKS